MTKKVITVGTLSFLLALTSFAAVADDKPDEPENAVASESADESEQPKTKSDDPIGDAEKEIDEAVKDIDKDPAGFVSFIVDLAKSGRWGPFAGQVLLFLVWALRKYIWKLIKPNVLPWVTLGGAIVASIAVGLIAGNVWWEIALDSLITGGSAMALWSLLFKHFMKPKEATA